MIRYDMHRNGLNWICTVYEDQWELNQRGIIAIYEGRGWGFVLNLAMTNEGGRYGL
jgi:hypothetical protein